MRVARRGDRSFIKDPKFSQVLYPNVVWIENLKISDSEILFFSANINFQGPSGHAFGFSGAHKNDAG